MENVNNEKNKKNENKEARKGSSIKNCWGPLSLIIFVQFYCFQF